MKRTKEEIEELARISEKIREVFSHGGRHDVVKQIEDSEKKFMEAIRALLYTASFSPGEEYSMTEQMNSCYDSTLVLADIQKLIDEYKTIFHIANCVVTWKKED